MKAKKWEKNANLKERATKASNHDQERSNHSFLRAFPPSDLKSRKTKQNKTKQKTNSRKSNPWIKEMKAKERLRKRESTFHGFKLKAKIMNFRERERERD